ncbi:TolC family protein [Clostridium sp. DJ247]|uniref:TolC family protein n=1 Tax=Clostridium sp. DJ247 TaxID=2726188 RepID=UPI00162AD646|nr:TolC family protein [Clostridium sp. DJ247]MBC2581560.1 TolC family protein [Clostridium sp. DJ247]
MKKKLSFLIAIAISLNVTTTCFAEASSAERNVVSITLEQAISKLESSNEELKNIDSQIDAANKQYNWDNQQSIAIATSGKAQSQYAPVQYAQLVIQRDLTPLSDQNTLDDIKNTKDERLNTMKFDLEQQYMKVLTYKQRIDNINKNIEDLDGQINQLQEKIKLGQSTKDELNPLYVKKNSLLSAIRLPQGRMEISLFFVKRYLNMSLNFNTDLKLSPAKKNFVKFDDTDIENKIIDASKNDYSYKSLQKSIDLSKKQVDIYTKYAYDSVTEPMNSQLTLQNLENKSTDTYTSTQVNLWNSYYNLKNMEDNVQTQNVALEAAQLSYDKAKQNFDNGLIDKVTLNFAALELDNQKTATQDAINDYMIAQEKFKYMLNGHASFGSIS